jgi:hypothetical protein
MSRKDDRVRGTILHLLDADKTTKFIKEYLETDADIHAEPMLVANGKQGIATICDEGVGWFVDKNGKLPINYYGKNGNSGYLDVTPEELAPLISNETMDLADFIRSFGDRLENNFYAWVQYAKSHDQKMSVA